MNRRGDLNLARNRVWQATLVEEILRRSLVALRVLVLDDNTVVVTEFIEPLLVDEAVALIDENVGILSLVTALIHEDALHVRIVSILLHLSLPMFILATVALFWNLARIEMLNHSVIELVPFLFDLFGLFSILD